MIVLRNRFMCFIHLLFVYCLIDCKLLDLNNNENESMRKDDIILSTLTANANATSTISSTISDGIDAKLSKKLPQAIIIGAKKCGTRALLKFIGAHYNVSAAGAEVHFFDRFYHMGLEWYRNQMPYSDDFQVTIEKTPKYFVDKQVPKRLHDMNSNVKLIIVLRDPVTRAISEYTQSMEKLKSRHIFYYNYSTQFEKMAFDKFGNIKTNWSVIRNGLYYKHLQEWLKYFDMNQLLFVNGEQLIKNPAIEIAKVQTFLGLDNLIEQKHFVYNYRKGFPCIIKPLDSGQIKCLSDQKGRKHPKISSNVVEKLRNFYRPFNILLFNQIKQKPFWPV